MLTMNSRLQSDDPSVHDVVRRSVASSEEEDGDDNDVHELDPVAGGFPDPPVRMKQRRRFVNSGQTTFELSFSRRHAQARRAGAGGRVNAVVCTRPVYHQSDAQDEYRPVPVVSSLSSVLTEVMTGKTTALNNIIDTTSLQPNVTYVVEHAADGTPYVAASDGHRYFANSTIGKIFLEPVLNPEASQGKRSEPDLRQSSGWQQEQPTRRSDSAETTTTTNSLSTLVAATKCADLVAQSDLDIKEVSKTLLGYKGFEQEKKMEKKEEATDLQALQEQDDSAHATLSGSTAAIAQQEIEKELCMLDPESALPRSRAKSRWEVPPVKSNARQVQELPQPTEIILLDSNGMQTANQARSDLLAGFAGSTNHSEVSGSNSSFSVDKFSISAVPSGASIKTLPRLQPKKDVPASSPSLDAYDEDDNPLCRSFQNVRNVDLIQSTSDEVEEEGHEHGHDEEHEYAAAAASDDTVDDVAGRVCVSSGTTSVAEFVGGFKGQLFRRSGASGMMNRKRAVRHARLTVEEQKAAELARKIAEARNRIPLEFRDEYMSPSAKHELQKKKDRLARGRHVEFNPDVLCREFEVESEDEDDGYDSPDEIVDAVQLVSKRDVVYAEDVVGAFPMEQLELPSEETEDADYRSFETDSPSALRANAERNRRVQNDLLTFSQLNNDKRLSVSDL